MKKYVSCVKNSAPVRSIKSNGKILSIALQDGSIKIYNLAQVASEHPRLSLLASLSTGLLKSGFSSIALSSESFAYTQAVREEPTIFSKLERNLDKSAVASYPMTKEAARRLLKVGEMGYNTVSSLISINKATSSSSNHSSPLPPPIQTLNQSSNSDSQSNNSSPTTPKIVHLLIVKTLQGKELIRTCLPYFPIVSSLHFSPSGELLVVANQKAQYFFVLRIYADTENSGEPSEMSPPPSYSILYSLFRGYTPAIVNSVCFSLDERWLSIGTDHGTSHLFRLDTHNSSSPQFIPRGSLNKAINERGQFRSKEGLKGDDTSLREISHLSAFGRVKLTSSNSKSIATGSLVFLTHYRPGYEYSTSISNKIGENNSHGSSHVKLVMVIGNDGIVRTVELKVKNGKENGNNGGKQHLLGGILKRNQIPSKSNYFLEYLELRELASYSLFDESKLQNNSKSQKSPQLFSKFENTEISKEKSVLIEASIERHLAKSRHSFTVIKNPSSAQWQNEQMRRRKIIKQWVASSQIKSAAVLYTPLQQSPLFEICKYDQSGQDARKKESELALLRSPSKRKELEAVRLTLIQEKRYSSLQQENQLNESLQISHYSQQPRVVVYARVKKDKQEQEQDPLGVLASYSGLSQSMFQASLDEARQGQVAPMFEEDVSKQGVVLSRYEIQDEYTRNQ